MINKKLSITAILILMAPVVLIYHLSTSPAYTYSAKDDAMLIVSFKKLPAKAEECNEEELKANDEYLKKRRKHMQRTRRVCGSRERVPMDVNLWINGENAFAQRHFPAGFYTDGYIYVYKQFKLKSGSYKVKVTAREQKEGGGRSYVFEDTIEFNDRRVVVVDFDKGTDRFFVN